MPLTPGQIFREWFEEIWNNGRTDLIDKHMSPNAVIHGREDGGAVASGSSGFRPFYDKMRAAFPDIHFEIQDIIETGSLAAARWKMTMTHSGKFQGVAATNRAVAITGMTIIRVTDNQIVEGWNEWDRLTLMGAIGAVVPASETSETG